MSFGNVKLRKSDTIYSKYLRKKRGYRCERCRRPYEEGRGLECSHFYGRAKESVRFDEQNTDCLCAGCHQYFTANPGEYTDWKREKLGEKAYKALTLRANLPGKRDDKLAEMVFSKLLLEL